MVSIADFDEAPAPVLQSRRSRTLTIAAAGTGLAVLLAIGGFVIRGGGINGTRFGAGLVLAAASIAFVVAYIAQPLSRLVPADATRTIARERAGLNQAFACMYAVFLASIVLPGGFSGEPVALPTLTFAVISTAILAVLVFGASARRILGASAGRAVLGLASAYFWCAFAVNDLNHMIGPRRADWLEPLYELSLALLVLALLIRFADSFMERRKVRMAETP